MGRETHKKPIETEMISRLNARRSIILKMSVKSGEILTEQNLTYKRPGTGISPLHWDEIIGSISRKDLKEDDLLTWGDFEKKR